MARKEISINLVEENLNFVDRFISWALTIGRVVVIVTELIALTAFLYRFSLDRQLIDLHSKIKQEQAVVDYLKDYERTFRDIQNRLSLSYNFGGIASDRIKLLNDVVSFAPQGMTFNTLSLQEDRIRMSVMANSVSAMSDFINHLKSYSKIASVNIEKVQDRTSSASITIDLTAMLKTYAKK